MREKLSLTLDPELVEAVKKAAAHERLSVSRMMEVILKEYIRKVEEQKKK